MAQYLLLILITFAPGQPAQVWQLSGQYDYQTCRGLIPMKVSEAQQVYPGAVVTGQCLQMVKP